ncbi:MAG: leucyl aminopeptidase [Campylobacteraceae bacterium 4484_166]|nr:MAG: leucyl aminopeptidase [Campylobacteraceae bacterium 4484_166]
MNIKINKQIEQDDIKVILIDKIDGQYKESLNLLNFKIEDENFVFLSQQRVFIVAFETIDKNNTKIGLSIATRELKKTNFTNLFIEFDRFISSAVMGAYLGAYEFDRYKSKKTKKSMSLNIISDDITQDTKDNIKENIIISDAVNMVRDFVNTAPDDFYPKIMANKAKEIANTNGLQCDIYSDDYFNSHGMGAIMAVGRASRHKSKLIHMRYSPATATTKKIVLVGKGLTYDSGGLSLKPSDYMAGMKSDKSGGCVVLALMSTIAKLKLPIEVHGIVGAVENMIGGDAYKPDDVLVAKNGKTIEVKNTDAEGRLVLADCLCYAQDTIDDISLIIDFATLTGACVVGVGNYTTGIMGNNDMLKYNMVQKANISGEFATSLPFNRYLKKQLKSDIADISNIASSRYGGAITAGLFLDQFIEDRYKQKWLHCDIAGPSFVDEIWGVNPKGASGAGVRMCLEFLKDFSTT